MVHFAEFSKKVPTSKCRSSGWNELDAQDYSFLDTKLHHEEQFGLRQANKLIDM